MNTFAGMTVNGKSAPVDQDDPTDATAVLNKLYSLLRIQPFTQLQLKYIDPFTSYALQGPWL